MGSEGLSYSSPVITLKLLGCLVKSSPRRLVGYFRLKKQGFGFLRCGLQSFSEMFPSCSQEIFLNRKSEYHCVGRGIPSVLLMCSVARDVAAVTTW